MLSAMPARSEKASGLATSARFALAHLFGGPTRTDSGQLACASCHQEHRGRDHEIVGIDDVRCQVCHRTQFESFAIGHPQFAIEDAKEGVGFDHFGHRENHFPSSGAEFDCLRCHVPDPAGTTMQVAPFGDACGTCHEKDYSAYKLTVFRLPKISGVTDAWESSYWSKDCARRTTLTDPMQFLLAGADDASVVDALRALPDGSVKELTIDDEALKPLARAMLQVPHLLSLDQLGSLRIRLAAVLEAQPTDADVVALADQLAAAAPVAKAYKRWLDTACDRKDRPKEAENGWSIDARDKSIVYSPTSHADPFLRALADAWIDADREISPQPVAAAEETEPTVEDVRRELRSQIFREELTEGKFYKACGRCHLRDGAYSWSMPARAAAVAGSVPFHHNTHLTAPAAGAVCTRCHVLDKEAAGGVLAHTKEQCASCHAPGGVGEGCLTCHEYHLVRP